MICLWGRPSAYNVQKVIWLLQELGLSYEHIDIGSPHQDLLSASFLALNPHGRIPVLKDNDQVIWESNTILRYLCRQYAPSLLMSEDAYQQSRVERWMDWELATWQVDFLSLFWRYYRTPEAEHDLAVIQQAFDRCLQHLHLIDKQLTQQRFLLGDDFSLADICVGTALFRLFNLGLAIPKFPHLQSWFSSLCDRKTYQRAVMIDFSSLKGRQDY